MGGDPIFGPFSTPAIVQSAKACRDFVLQYGPHPFRVVESVGHSWGAFQSGEVVSYSALLLTCRRFLVGLLP